MKPSVIAPQLQRTIIRFPGPSMQVSRKTLEVLASALEDVRLFYGLSSLQALARDETQRLVRSEAVVMTLPSSDHVLSVNKEDS